MANDKELIIDMDALLDGTLDDIADLPEFKPFPAGAHKCIINIVGPKKIGTHPAFELKMKAIETVEKGATDEVVSKDQETSVAFMMDNEMGQGKFKEILNALKAQLGGNSNRETIANAQNAEVIVITAVRQDKAKTKSFTDVVSLGFL